MSISRKALIGQFDPHAYPWANHCTEWGRSALIGQVWVMYSIRKSSVILPWKGHELRVGRECPRGRTGPINRSRCWADKSRIPLQRMAVPDGDMWEGTGGRREGLSKGLGVCKHTVWSGHSGHVMMSRSSMVRFWLQFWCVCFHTTSQLHSVTIYPESIRSHRLRARSYRTNPSRYVRHQLQVQTSPVLFWRLPSQVWLIC